MREPETIDDALELDAALFHIAQDAKRDGLTRLYEATEKERRQLMQAWGLCYWCRDTLDAYQVNSTGLCTKCEREAQSAKFSI